MTDINAGISLKEYYGQVTIEKWLCGFTLGIRVPRTEIEYLLKNNYDVMHNDICDAVYEYKRETIEGFRNAELGEIFADFIDELLSYNSDVYYISFC